jgi:hypothetical protein
VCFTDAFGRICVGGHAGSTICTLFGIVLVRDCAIRALAAVPLCVGSHAFSAFMTVTVNTFESFYAPTSGLGGVGFMVRTCAWCTDGFIAYGFVIPLALVWTLALII